MRDKLTFKRAFEKRLTDTRQSLKNDSFPAFAGDFNNVVNDPNNPGYVFVRTFAGLVLSVYNPGNAIQPNTSLLIGYSTYDRHSYRVLEVWDVYGSPVNRVMRHHGETHSWGGTDATPIWMDQFLFWKVFPSEEGVALTVYRGTALSAAGYVVPSQEVVDLTADLPTAGSRYALIEVKGSDGSLHVKHGDVVVAQRELLLPSHAPKPSAGAKGLALVRTYFGQTRVIQNTNDTDLWDVRFADFFRTANYSQIIVDPSVIGNYPSFADTVGTFQDSGFAAHAPITLPTDSGLTLAAQVLTLGTPSTNNQASDNTVTADTHAHKVEGFLKGKLKSAAPTIIDDVSAGYLKTDVWLNQLTGDAYICVDNTTGAAVWLQLASSGVGGVSDLSFNVDGVLATGTNVTNAILSTKAAVIDKIYLYAKTPGTSGSTIIDVKMNGVTLFTTSGNRPELLYSDVDHLVFGIPDITAVPVDAVLTLDIAQVAVGAADIVVVISAASSSATLNFIVSDGATTVDHVGEIIIHNGVVHDDGSGQARVEPLLTVDDGSATASNVKQITFAGIAGVTDEGSGHALVTVPIYVAPETVTENPDNHPAVPNAMDDEFEAGTLDGKWTSVISSGSSAVVAFATSKVLLGHLAAVAEGYRHCSIYQTKPAGNCKFRAKITMESGAQNYIAGGIGVRVSSTNHVYRFMFMAHSGLAFNVGTLSDATGETNNGESYPFVLPTMTGYFEVEFTATEIIFRYSSSGYEGTFCFAGSIALGFIGTVDQVGVITSPWTNGSTPCLFSCDWFRRIA